MKQRQAARCGLSSARRGAKMVSEFAFSLVLGLPPLLAAVSVLVKQLPGAQQGLVRIAEGPSSPSPHSALCVPRASMRVTR